LTICTFSFATGRCSFVNFFIGLLILWKFNLLRSLHSSYQINLQPSELDKIFMTCIYENKLINRVFREFKK
jgi:hypothetical protein